MTPAARDAAAIAVLDRWCAGEPAEAALTRWARGARYAGSSDRAAVRDLVFTAIRRARSARALGSTDQADAGGRALRLGLAREVARALGPDALAGWTGEGHAPPPPCEAEAALLASPVPDDLPRGIRCDMPDWLLPLFDDALGDRADPVMQLLRDRAPVFLRAHAARIRPPTLAAALAEDGIAAHPHPLSPWALEVTAGARRVRQSGALRDGLAELQDAASQAVVAAFAQALPSGTAVLDFCAGGGGKALALAALGHRVSAHDIDPARMADLPARADRAGTPVEQIAQPQGRWPAVLADVPCSGSGSWRRAPEGKWALTPERLRELNGLQDAILDRCAGLVARGGVLGYATCSVFRGENESRIAGFLARSPGWAVRSQHRWSPLDGGDGFYLALLDQG